MDELAVRLAELEKDGGPTSGTAKNVEEVYAREKYYERKQQAEGDQSTTGANDGETELVRWGVVSGFCSLGSMSFAAEPLGGVPLADFDVDETVQRLWTDRTGIRCWGGFASVMDAACDSRLDCLQPMAAVYIRGSPCPDYSRAGLGNGVSGHSGSLWIGDCHLGIRLQPPAAGHHQRDGDRDLRHGQRRTVLGSGRPVSQRRIHGGVVHSHGQAPRGSGVASARLPGRNPTRVHR